MTSYEFIIFVIVGLMLLGTVLFIYVGNYPLIPTADKLRAPVSSRGAGPSILKPNEQTLIFLSKDCRFCKMLMPFLENLSKMYPDLDFVVVDADSDDPRIAQYDVKYTPYIIRVDKNTGAKVEVFPEKLEKSTENVMSFIKG